MLLRRVAHGEGITEKAKSEPINLHATTVELFKQITGNQSASDLSELIMANSVPQWIVKAALVYIDSHPELASITDVQFRAAAIEARPDLGAILDGVAGRRWTETVAWKIAAGLPLHWLGSLFGR